MHPTHHNPANYPRRILLAVTGLSPQIVTETLYALAMADPPGFLPTEIHLLTTLEGAKRARLSLLSQEPGWFDRLCREYELPDMTFTEAHIQIIQDPDGRPLEDIRSPADNLAAADQITDTVRRLTEDEHSALHVSIAGGRKTMGFFLGYALSLFGRPQDRLSHVLVSEPFESTWDFFYPSRQSRVLNLPKHGPVDAREATVTLADIPFVGLRHGLDTRLMEGRVTYREVVENAREAFAPPSLVIRLPERSLTLGRRNIQLPPTQMALYVLFARRAMDSLPPLEAPCKEVPDAAWRDRYLEALQAVQKTPMADNEMTENALSKGMDGHYFSQLLSRLHKSLRTQLGPSFDTYKVQDGGSRPRKYRLGLTPEQIRIVE
ncbi:CRISPR-associated ring nuclease Csm6 [Ectothiorhodospira shaposhnikovii]|uniref:CRISPR-associated ring nuclease Csm6 n=1 Tax=Ectothiorhodospira shaposhnikovii TaxID=1054 RepID=UPI0039A0FAB8